MNLPLKLKIDIIYFKYYYNNIIIKFMKKNKIKIILNLNFKNENTKEY